jgi:nuclear pore complex protein Nup107
MSKKLFPCLKFPLICYVLLFFLSHLQVSVSLMGSGVQPDSHDNLIELVGSPETRFLDLFSQQQLQARYYFLKKY